MSAAEAMTGLVVEVRGEVLPYLASLRGRRARYLHARLKAYADEAALADPNTPEPLRVAILAARDALAHTEES